MNRIKSAFSSNAVIKEHDVQEQIASGGPGLLWKIHRGIFRQHKKPVAVWIFDKKGLNADKSYTKHQKEAIIKVLKKGAAELVKLKHPSVLAITYPLAESKDSLAFATEPVFCSLANALGRIENIERVPLELKDYELLDIEKLMGLIQLSAALDFLHKAEMIHGNITPESIILNKNGEWRIAGVDFISHARYQDDSKYIYPETNVASSVIRSALPNLNYRAPEYELEGRGDITSDIYALGNIVYSLWNNGHPLCECQGNILTYNLNLEKISRMAAGDIPNIPNDLKELVKLMLNAHQSIRPTAEDFGRAPCFDNMQISCLRYLQNIYEKSDPNKAKFMKGLTSVLSSFPKRVLIKKVLPPLLEECKKPIMIPFVLPNIMAIAEGCSMVEFEELFFPHLEPVFALEDPVQIMSIFLLKFEVLLTRTPKSKLQEHIYPILFRSLRSKSHQLQLQVLQLLPGFQESIDYAIMKNTIVPLIQDAGQNTEVLNVRIQSLVCIGKLLPSFDKWFVRETIIPWLLKLPSREPGVVMAFFGILDLGLNDPKYGLDAAVIAKQLLPFATPLMVEPGLNAQQVANVLAIVKKMVNSVETERVSALTANEQMQSEAKETVGLAEGASTSVTMDTMESLVKSNTSAYDISAASSAAAQADAAAVQKANEEALRRANEVAASFATPTVVPGHGGADGSDIFGVMSAHKAPASIARKSPRESSTGLLSAVSTNSSSQGGLLGLNGGDTSHRRDMPRTSSAYKGVQNTDPDVMGNGVATSTFGTSTNSGTTLGTATTSSLTGASGGAMSSTMGGAMSSTMGGAMSSTMGGAMSNTMGGAMSSTMGGAMSSSSSSSAGNPFGSPSPTSMSSSLSFGDGGMGLFATSVSTVGTAGVLPAGGMTSLDPFGAMGSGSSTAGSGFGVLGGTSSGSFPTMAAGSNNGGIFGMPSSSAGGNGFGTMGNGGDVGSFGAMGSSSTTGSNGIFGGNGPQGLGGGLGGGLGHSSGSGLLLPMQGLGSQQQPQGQPAKNANLLDFSFGSSSPNSDSLI